MDCPDLGVCNPSVIQPNVRRQATFLNRDTESVVALTPNIRLIYVHQRSFPNSICTLVSESRYIRKLDSRRASRPIATANADEQIHEANKSLHLCAMNSGGADRDRTGGLLVANQALSQLSYSPTIKWWAWVELNYRPHPYQGCALAN
jgi:hypothetical protein